VTDDEHIVPSPELIGGAQNVGYKLRIPQRKPWASIEDDVNSAVALAQSTDRLLKGVPSDSEDVGRQWIADIKEGLRLLQGVVRTCCGTRIHRAGVC
jgi:hypothetical protein